MTRRTRSPEPPGTAADYPPYVLREYAFLADGERGVLVGPRGNCAWMCAPRWDSDAVFSSLVGGGGCYAITPSGRFVWGGYYEDGGLIWRSRWVTETGIVECREALRFPADPARAVLLRQVVAVEGEADLHVLLEPRAGFGACGIADLAAQDGRWTGRTGALRFRWSGGAAARPTGDRGSVLRAELRLRPGESHDFVLELADGTLPDEPVEPAAAWRTTENAWRAALPDLSGTICPADARHAYAVLRGMTGRGGMVAAATTSLPERAAQGRNYDYRYVWVRDQCLAGEAVAAAGGHPLLDAAVGFVRERILADGPELKPAYTTLAGPLPEPRRLELAGYPGGYDVVGNRVNDQFQLDTLGEALLLFAAAARHDRLDADGWRAVGIAADAIAQRWQEREAGIWELDDHNWTEGRLICVAGLRAAAAAAGARGRSGGWLALADAILARTAAESVHPSGRWQRAADDEGLDAALLLPPLRGAPAADDPRTLATLHALESELAEDNYLYRFRHDAGRLGDAEGAFLLCGLTMALALHQQGREVDAVRWFERNRAAGGPPGLLTEEFDVAQRQLRGNIPQAFVHAMLLECSSRLSRPWTGH